MKTSTAAATPLKAYRIHYVLLNDETEYAWNVQAHDADDAETRFMGDVTEYERNTLTITSVEAIQ